MILLPLLSALVVASFADVVTLTSGETMTGIVLSRTKESIKLKLGDNSEIELPMSAVESVRMQSEHENGLMGTRWHEVAAREDAQAIEDSRRQALMDEGMTEQDANVIILKEKMKKRGPVHYAPGADAPPKAKAAKKTVPTAAQHESLDERARKAGLQFYEGEWMSAEEIEIRRRDEELDQRAAAPPRRRKVARPMAGRR